jgi:hypothetical protein
MRSLSYDIRDRWGGREDQQIKTTYIFLLNFIYCRASGGSRCRSPSPSSGYLPTDLVGANRRPDKKNGVTTSALVIP